jgi:predicted ribosome quality control (RQC) complex YloA/Tae2 family protein
MALDGIMLRSIAGSLQSLVGGRINKIQNLNEEEVVFFIHTKEAGQNKLVISLRSNTNRLYLSQLADPQPEPSSFVMVLRKHLSQGGILAIEQEGWDRIIRFDIQTRNELGDVTIMHLCAELMGKYANLVLAGPQGNIIDALKRIPVSEDARRLIHPGAKYVLPQQPGKQNPDEVQTLDLDKPLTAQVAGMSPLLAKEVQHRMRQGQDFYNIVQEAVDSTILHVYDAKTFHTLALTHLNVPGQEKPLMEGLESIYAGRQEKDRLRKDLSKIAETELSRNIRKLPKLKSALKSAQDADIYRRQGELLYAYADEIEKKPEVILEDFETGEPVKISLDMRLSVKDNASRLFAKYHKLRRSVEVLEKQIAICEEDIRYFQQLVLQLAHASRQDAQEIREELVKAKIIQAKLKPARKPKAPNYLRLEVDGAVILVGKNNIQNQYVTHKLAKRNNLWFHAKDYHGAHVVLQAEAETEALIRMCAALAAWFSQGGSSSSVPVDYTRISQLKKVPGAKTGLVTMKTFNTIYIDPQEDEIIAWISKYQKSRN